jgi:cobalt-zinc-cadmium efflux system outer membrane protein
MPRTSPLFLWFVFFALQSLYSQTPGLDSLIAEALANNPQLQSAGHAAEAAKTRMGQVSAWDAPQVGIDFFDTPIRSFPIPTRKNMETDYFVQQTIPWPGKLSAKAEVEKYGHGIAQQNYFALKRKIIRDLKNVYFELYLIQKKIEINMENQTLIRSLITIAMKQFETAKGRQSDVVRAQSQLSLLMEDEASLENEKVIAESTINSLLNRPVDRPVERIPEMATSTHVDAITNLTSLADENRAELQAANLNIQMNQSVLQSSRKEYYPDIMMRASYKRWANVSDTWELMVGANIPLAWWSKNKYKNQAAEAQWRIKQSMEEYTSMKNSIHLELKTALANLKTNHHHIELYKNAVIPQAEHTLNLVLSEYQAGLTEFLMVIDAYRMLLTAKVDHQMHIAEFLKNEADLEEAVGLGLNAIHQKLNEHVHEE